MGFTRFIGGLKTACVYTGLTLLLGACAPFHSTVPHMSDDKSDSYVDFAAAGRFIETGEELAARFRESGLTDRELGFSVESFGEAVANVTLDLHHRKAAHLKAEGLGNRDARNDRSSNLISFIGSKFTSKTILERERLVLHEYLRFTKTPDGSEYVNDHKGIVSGPALRLLRERETSL